MTKINSLLLLGFTLLLFNCNKTEKYEKVISKHGEKESHYTGRNCMDCHHTSGKGEGWFTLAGSTFGDQYKNGTIIAMSKEGDLSSALLKVEIDKKGNAFTTEEIDYTNGVYFAIEQKNGSVKYMESVAYNGQCNLCHGATTEVLK